MSERLSEAGRRHIEESQSRAATPCGSLSRDQSPFRPESPYYTPPTGIAPLFPLDSVNPSDIDNLRDRAKAYIEYSIPEVEAEQMVDSSNAENISAEPDIPSDFDDLPQNLIRRYQHSELRLLEVVKHIHDPNHANNMEMLRDASDCINAMAHATAKINAFPDDISDSASRPHSTARSSSSLPTATTCTICQKFTGRPSEIR